MHHFYVCLAGTGGRDAIMAMLGAGCDEMKKSGGRGSFFVTTSPSRHAFPHPPPNLQPAQSLYHVLRRHRK